MMKPLESAIRKRANRRSFLKNGMAAAGAATLGAGLFPRTLSALGREDDDRAPVTKGDIAILKFMQTVEQIEADLWTQYSELGGTQDNDVSGVNGGNSLYAAALQILDGDMPQYIHDNTEDEITHVSFLANYLESKGAEPVSLDRFRTLPSSKAAGAQQNQPRLTNLTQLTIDTSFWSRYRSLANPDFDPAVMFAQAVPSLNMGQHTAIPRTDEDTEGSSLSIDNTKSITKHLQAIAFTAGFHFAFIEQGGTSLYPTMALKATNLEVLRVLLSIGPSETMHFQTWQDKAGNALPLSDTDKGFPGSTGATVKFTDLKSAKGEDEPDSLKGDTLQANLIMPEPTHFLSPSFGPVAIIRPTSTKNSGAMAAVHGLTVDGLFSGQSPDFFTLLHNLAREADAAEREF